MSAVTKETILQDIYEETRKAKADRDENRILYLEDLRDTLEVGDLHARLLTEVIKPNPNQLVVETLSARIQYLQNAISQRTEKRNSGRWDMDADAFCEMLIKRLLARTLVPRNASDGESVWYADHFHFGLNNRLPLSVSSAEISAFVRQFSPHLNIFRESVRTAAAHHEQYVQEAMIPMFKKFIEIFLPETSADFTSRTVSTLCEDVIIDHSFKHCRVTGVPDCSSVYGSDVIGISVWELKNRQLQIGKDPLRGYTALFYKGCCQLAVYLKADMDAVFATYGIVYQHTAGILTNGRYWTLVWSRRDSSDASKVHWFHTTPVEAEFDLAASSDVTLDDRKRRQILKLILFAGRIARANLDLILAQTLEQHFDDLEINDEEENSRPGTTDKKLGGGRAAGASAGAGAGAGPSTSSSSSSKSEKSSKKSTKSNSSGNNSYQATEAKRPPLKQLTLNDLNLRALGSMGKSSCIGKDSFNLVHHILDNRVSELSVKELFEDE